MRIMRKVRNPISKAAPHSWQPTCPSRHCSYQNAGLLRFLAVFLGPHKVITRQDDLWRRSCSRCANQLYRAALNAQAPEVLSR